MVFSSSDFHYLDTFDYQRTRSRRVIDCVTASMRVICNETNISVTQMYKSTPAYSTMESPPRTYHISGSNLNFEKIGSPVLVLRLGLIDHRPCSRANFVHHASSAGKHGL